ncbi:hypothetical protein [Bacillus tuaregi]|uniref:hypothetical protein n=1 Tax=Bacillus tuaregi TaxID=1816695 RepID=UPI0008F88EF6|nr:hypothetical protein [Bacillus tuaregi]
MNIISNLISGLNQNGALSDLKTASFQPGQIVNGKIIKLFPNGMASLQIGSQKIVAQLEAALVAHQSYWFQVQPGDGKVRLKVLTASTKHGSAPIDPLPLLLKELQIPADREHLELTRYFLKEQLPFDKDMIEQAIAWIKEVDSNKSGFEAIKQMVLRELPMTKSTFQALLAANDTVSLTEGLEELDGILGQSKSKVAQPLKWMIEHLLQSNHERNSFSSVQKTEGIEKDVQPSMLAEKMKELMQQIGYTHEYEIGRLVHGKADETSLQNTLKGLLLNFIQEDVTEVGKNLAERMLHKITGLQLLAQDVKVMEQFALQIPFPLGHKTIDLTMQWSGRKNKKGQMDPAYCRVLFYLELQQLKETMIDMQVQNRIITLTVVNEHPHLKQLAIPYINILTENLQAFRFTLSAVSFVRPSEQNIKQLKASSLYTGQSSYSGVDVRI